MVAAGGLWTAATFLLPRRSADPPRPSPDIIRAGRDSHVAGRDLSISRHHGLQGWEVALLLAVVLGIGLVALAFAGTRIAVENGVGVGGDVSNSTITIQPGTIQPGSVQPGSGR